MPSLDLADRTRWAGVGAGIASVARFVPRVPFGSSGVLGVMRGLASIERPAVRWSALRSAARSLSGPLALQCARRIAHRPLPRQRSGCRIPSPSCRMIAGGSAHPSCWPASSPFRGLPLWLLVTGCWPGCAPVAGGCPLRLLLALLALARKLRVEQLLLALHQFLHPAHICWLVGAAWLPGAARRFSSMLCSCDRARAPGRVRRCAPAGGRVDMRCRSRPVRTARVERPSRWDGVASSWASACRYCRAASRSSCISRRSRVGRALARGPARLLEAAQSARRPTYGVFDVCRCPQCCSIGRSHPARQMRNRCSAPHARYTTVSRVEYRVCSDR